MPSSSTFQFESPSMLYYALKTLEALELYLSTTFGCMTRKMTVGSLRKRKSSTTLIWKHFSISWIIGVWYTWLAVHSNFLYFGVLSGQLLQDSQYMQMETSFHSKRVAILQRDGLTSYFQS